MGLSLQNLAKSYGHKKTISVLNSFSFEADTGEFVTIIGPSGCGKSTLCNLISGLEVPDQGRILLDGQPITGETGHVGYMPQKDLLLPWRTLWENVALGLILKGLDKAEIKTISMQWLERFGLSSFAEHYPQQLSGGMRQRGALLRTILFGKKTLLLDEPFGALDALTRREMQEWLLSVWQETRNTVFFITHDIEEGILLSDKIIVLNRRPASIVKVLPIPFPHPRHPDILLSSEAISIKRELLELLR